MQMFMVYNNFCSDGNFLYDNDSFTCEQRYWLTFFDFDESNWGMSCINKFNIYDNLVKIVCNLENNSYKINKT